MKKHIKTVALSLTALAAITQIGDTRCTTTGARVSEKAQTAGSAIKNNWVRGVAAAALSGIAYRTWHSEKGKTARAQIANSRPIKSVQQAAKQCRDTVVTAAQYTVLYSICVLMNISLLLGYQP